MFSVNNVNLSMTSQITRSRLFEVNTRLVCGFRCPGMEGGLHKFWVQ